MKKRGRVSRRACAGFAKPFKSVTNYISETGIALTMPTLPGSPALATSDFSNRPFEVKHFQAIHHRSVDVAHGLALLFGIEGFL